MYETKEIFKEDGYDIEDLLKSCFYNYYIKYCNKGLNNVQKI